MNNLNNETDTEATNRIIKEIDKGLERNHCSIAETVCLSEIIKFKAIIQTTL